MTPERLAEIERGHFHDSLFNRRVDACDVCELLTALRDEEKEHAECHKDFTKALEEALVERDDLQRWAEGLEKYVWHVAPCPQRFTGPQGYTSGECSCGLTAVLRGEKAIP